MRTIGVVTVARSDYGIYLPVLRGIEADPDLTLRLIVGGMHLSPEFGSTVDDIEADGFAVSERVEMLVSSDTPGAIAKSMGLGTIGFAEAYARSRPDILLVLGDRFEMHSAVVASLPFKIPVAHIHGGETTEGQIDEPIRHSITKMSHLHFVSMEPYRRRVVQMGEDPQHVVVSGAPSLDNLRTFVPLSVGEFKDLYDIDLDDPTLLVTYHPVTLEYERTEAQMEQLLDALRHSEHQVVFTYPNSDTYGRVILEMVREFASVHAWAKVAANFGTRAYFSLMSHVAAMVGNSSSGIIEAASFKLPVINIGNRQRGRAHGENVIDVGYCGDEVLAGIKRAVSKGFRVGLEDLVNPYGDGHATPRILEKLKRVALDDRLMMKRFHPVGATS